MYLIPFGQSQKSYTIEPEDIELPRSVEDGDSQTKKILDISLEFFLLHRRPDDL